MKERPARSSMNASGLTNQPSKVNVMDIPSYDNGTGYTPPAPAVRRSPARRPEIHGPLRVTSQQVSHGHFPPQSSYTSTPPTLRHKQKFAATQLTALPPAPGMVNYLSRPLPLRPGSVAVGAARPKGVSKPAVNLNKPLPAVPRGEVCGVKPTPNGIYTSTGQRISGAVEKSKFSSTTTSSRDVRRKQTRNKAIQSFGSCLLAATEGNKITKAPALIKTPVTARKPGQTPVRSKDSRHQAEGAGDKYRQYEDTLSEARLAAARQMITRGRMGLYKSAWETPQWQALASRERAIIKHELDMESARRSQERTEKNKKSNKCVVM
jgi:hypothetical protein